MAFDRRRECIYCITLVQQKTIRLGLALDLHHSEYIHGSLKYVNTNIMLLKSYSSMNMKPCSSTSSLLHMYQHICLETKAERDSSHVLFVSRSPSAINDQRVLKHETTD